MSDQGQTSIERLQEIMTSLMERLLLNSLEEVELAIGSWRSGSSGVFETHAELLKHAARAERLAERMAQIGLDNASALLRDAFDVGLIELDEFEQFTGQRPADVEPSPPLSETVQGIEGPGKRGVLEELMGDGPVLIHIDAGHPLAQVPEKFRGDPRLVLRFGYQLTPAIIDLSIDNDGVYGTLTFGGIPFRCVLPWASIYSVVSEADQKGMIWPEDVPESVVAALEATCSEEETVTNTHPVLSSIDLDDVHCGEETTDSASETSKPPPPGPRGGHLKLVK